MSWLKARWRGLALRPVLVILPLLLVGCLTAGHKPLFIASGPEWHVQQGQALWKPGRRVPELGGDLVMATDANGRCLVQFSKTPLPFVLAQTTRTNWFIEFPPRHLSFAGRWPPPTRLAWLYLPSALAGDSLPSALRFQRKPDGGWRLENTRSGESLEGYFGP